MWDWPSKPIGYAAIVIAIIFMAIAFWYMSR
jgi:hypothetical protein